MSEISETEIKAMTKEQNYMRGYKDGKSDVLDKIIAEITKEYVSSDPKDFVYTTIELRKVLEIIGKYKENSEC
jgi:hypothetical protein